MEISSTDWILLTVTIMFICAIYWASWEMENINLKVPYFFPIMLKVLEEIAVTAREGSGSGVVASSLGPPLMLNSLWHPRITLVSPFIIATPLVFE